MGLKEKILYKLMGTNEEIERIYHEKGHCDEWIEAYKAGHKKMKPMDRLSLADALISLERYSEAEEQLGLTKVNGLSDDITQGVYYLTLMNLYIGQKRAEEALAILENKEKFLNIFYSAPAYQRMSIAFYDSAAVILAMNGRYEAAAKYYSLEKQSAEKYDKTGILPMITNVRLLKYSGCDELAEKEAEATRNYIENYNDFKLPWQKAANLKLLNKSLK